MVIFIPFISPFDIHYYKHRYKHQYNNTSSHRWQDNSQHRYSLWNNDQSKYFFHTFLIAAWVLKPTIYSNCYTSFYYHRPNCLEILSMIREEASLLNVLNVVVECKIQVFSQPMGCFPSDWGRATITDSPHCWQCLIKWNTGMCWYWPILLLFLTEKRQCIHFSLYTSILHKTLLYVHNKDLTCGKHEMHGSERSQKLVFSWIILPCASVSGASVFPLADDGDARFLSCMGETTNKTFCFILERI